MGEVPPKNAGDPIPGEGVSLSPFYSSLLS